MLQAAIAVAKFAATSPDLEVRPQVRRELLGKYVLWLVTTGTAPGKYETRFQSVGALNRSRGTKLRHEHVFTRKSLVDMILGNPADEVIEFVLSNLAIGCTVTEDEHVRLTKFDRSHEGWQRYLMAGVEVFDMTTGEPVDLSDHELD